MNRNVLLTEESLNCLNSLNWEYLAVDTETTDLRQDKLELTGLILCDGINDYYIPITSSKGKGHELGTIKKYLKFNKTKRLVMHNAVFDLRVLSKYEIDLSHVKLFDTMIASYLINPGSRDHSLDDLTFVEFGHQKMKIKKVLDKEQGRFLILDIDPQLLSNYSCEDADFCFRLVGRLSKKLKEGDQLKLLYDIEMPLINVLIEMELNGVKIDDNFLKKLSKEAGRDIEKISKKIFSLAGEEFNISSPKQLKKILFEKLQIPTKGLKKIKTGISTAESELVKMAKLHPIIPLIQDYRELSKLKSTYLDALPKLVNPTTDRIHTSFNQAVTATGRLSSSDPNCFV